MSRHSGPDLTVPPDNQRCEALVKGKKSMYSYDWQREDHRCPRPSNQGRDGRMVCHIHGRSKKVVFCDA